MVEISGHGTIPVENHAVCIGSIIAKNRATLLPKVRSMVRKNACPKIMKAKRAILEPEAGPSLALKCEGDRNGVRWVKALRTRRHLIVVSNALATIVSTDVRYLPSGIFGRPPTYDVCCEAPSPSCDPRLLSSTRWIYIWTDYDP